MSALTPLHSDDYDSLEKFSGLISPIVKHREMMTEYIDEINKLDSDSEFRCSKTNRRIFAEIEKRLHSSRSLATSFERDIRKFERQLAVVERELSETWESIARMDADLSVENCRRYFRKLFSSHGGFLEPINVDFISDLQNGAHELEAAINELEDLAQNKDVYWKKVRQKIVAEMLDYRRLSYESRHSRQFVDLQGWDDYLANKAKALRKTITELKKKGSRS